MGQFNLSGAKKDDVDDAIEECVNAEEKTQSSQKENIQEIKIVKRVIKEKPVTHQSPPIRIRTPNDEKFTQAKMTLDSCPDSPARDPYDSISRLFGLKEDKRGTVVIKNPKMRLAFNEESEGETDSEDDEESEDENNGGEEEGENEENEKDEKKEDEEDEIILESTTKLLEALKIEIILKVTEYCKVLLEDESLLYDITSFYGIFKKETLELQNQGINERKIRIIFSSFTFTSERVNINSIPFKHVRNLFFDYTTFIPSKYLKLCQNLVSLINVKINQKTINKGLKATKDKMDSFDLKCYDFNSHVLEGINTLSNLKYLKINLRKKVKKKKSFAGMLDLKKLEVLEFWNSSAERFISLPNDMYTSIYYNLKNLVSICFVRISLTKKQLSCILLNSNIVEFEFLGDLTNDLIDLLKDNNTISKLIISGSNLDDDYIDLFESQSLKILNLSGCNCDEELLDEVQFSENNKFEIINLNGFSIPISLISKLCFLKNLRNLHLERTKLSANHLREVNDQLNWRKTLSIFINKEGDKTFTDEIGKFEKRRRNQRILQGTSIDFH